jgi:hypothetical protein
MALVRRHLWNHLQFSMSQQETDMIKIPRVLLERFTEALCYAAKLDKVKLKPLVPHHTGAEGFVIPAVAEFFCARQSPPEGGTTNNSVYGRLDLWYGRHTRGLSNIGQVHSAVGRDIGYGIKWQVVA